MSNTKKHIQLHYRQMTENHIYYEMKASLQMKKILCHYFDINMKSDKICNYDIIWKGNTIDPNKSFNEIFGSATDLQDIHIVNTKNIKFVKDKTINTQIISNIIKLSENKILYVMSTNNNNELKIGINNHNGISVFEPKINCKHKYYGQYIMIQYDEISHKLYLLNKHTSDLICLNVNQKSIAYSTNLGLNYVDNMILHENKCLYIWTNYFQNMHQYNFKSQSIQKISKYKNYTQNQCSNSEIYTKKILYDKRASEFTFLSILETYSQDKSIESSLLIKSFNLKSHKWSNYPLKMHPKINTLDISHELFSASMTICKNQQYVFMISCPSGKEYAWIYVYDCIKKTISQTNLCIQKLCYFYGIEQINSINSVCVFDGAKDILLIQSYVNMIYRYTKNMNNTQRMPIYLNKIIGYYFTTELLHIFVSSDFNNFHWRINVDQIIQNINK